MYLFLQLNPEGNVLTILLYIPQCIYFYHRQASKNLANYRLYIPQCIYFYLVSNFEFSHEFYFTFHNVSISTKVVFDSDGGGTSFTFHNVSISTQESGVDVIPTISLYIPQCIYFYHEDHLNSICQYRFTFHNVSISTPSNLLTLKYSDYIPCFVDFLPYINSITNLYLW